MSFQMCWPSSTSSSPYRHRQQTASEASVPWRPLSLTGELRSDQTRCQICLWSNWSQQTSPCLTLLQLMTFGGRMPWMYQKHADGLITPATGSPPKRNRRRMNQCQNRRKWMLTHPATISNSNVTWLTLTTTRVEARLTLTVTQTLTIEWWCILNVLFCHGILFVIVLLFSIINCDLHTFSNVFMLLASDGYVMKSTCKLCGD